MQQLSVTEGLVIRQRIEMGEVLTGLETKNRYEVSDQNGAPLYFAKEEGGSFLLRWWLKALRPFLIMVRNAAGQAEVKVERPFRFFFHHARVFDGEGRPLGSITRKLSVFSRIYAVDDPEGKEMYRLKGPLWHPWTFFIQKDGVLHGKIAKKWRGLLKEGVTDADKFGVAFPPKTSPQARALLLGAVFLIDFVHFENRR